MRTRQSHDVIKLWKDLDSALTGFGFTTLPSGRVKSIRRTRRLVEMHLIAFRIISHQAERVHIESFIALYSFRD